MEGKNAFTPPKPLTPVKNGVPKVTVLPEEDVPDCCGAVEVLPPV